MTQCAVRFYAVERCLYRYKNKLLYRKRKKKKKKIAMCRGE
jgi:hypothetical protein